MLENDSAMREKFHAFRILTSLKQARKRRAKQETCTTGWGGDNEQSVGLRRVRGAWIGSLAEHSQCKHTRLNRAAYVRQCSVRFEVVRGDGVHVTRRVGTNTRATPRRAARVFTDDEQDDRLVLARTGWYRLYMLGWISNELVCWLIKSCLKLGQRWKIRFSAGISADFRVHPGGTMVTSIIPPRMKAIFPGQCNARFPVHPSRDI